MSDDLVNHLLDPRQKLQFILYFSTPPLLLAELPTARGQAVVFIVLLSPGSHKLYFGSKRDRWRGY